MASRVPGGKVSLNKPSGAYAAVMQLHMQMLNGMTLT